MQTQKEIRDEIRRKDREVSRTAAAEETARAVWAEAESAEYAACDAAERAMKAAALARRLNGPRLVVHELAADTSATVAQWAAAATAARAAYVALCEAQNASMRARS